MDSPVITDSNDGSFFEVHYDGQYRYPDGRVCDIRPIVGYMSDERIEVITKPLIVCSLVACRA